MDKVLPQQRAEVVGQIGARHLGAVTDEQFSEHELVELAAQVGRRTAVGGGQIPRQGQRPLEVGGDLLVVDGERGVNAAGVADRPCNVTR